MPTCIASKACVLDGGTVAPPPVLRIAVNAPTEKDALETASGRRRRK